MSHQRSPAVKISHSSIRSAHTADPLLIHILELAQHLLDIPIAVAGFTAVGKQVLHASVGLDACDGSDDLATVAITIQKDDLLVIPDTSVDSRLGGYILATQAPGIRFYAGARLRMPDSTTRVTLCLLDTEPRIDFSEAGRRTLRHLARLAMDWMALRLIEVERDATRSRFDHIAGTSPDGIICANERGRITFWNEAAERMFGYPASEALGQPINLLVAEGESYEKRSGFRRFGTRAARNLVGRTVELPGRHRDGAEFPVELSLSTWLEGGKTAFGAILRDVSERRAFEERLFNLSRHDTLTGLLNRDVLRGILASDYAASQPVAVLILNLDAFKDVNEDHGHAAGDTVLRLTAERLRFCIGSKGIAARVGGDEFAVILRGVSDPPAALSMAEAIRQTLAEPFDIEGVSLRLSASIGLVLSASHGDGATDLLACADAALDRAKCEGRGRCRLFSPDIREAAHRERTYREDLRRAVERDEFELYYQPQVRLSDGSLVGAEALIRWRHPQRGLMGPATFLATLEKGQYAAEIGEWVLLTACAQAAKWSKDCGSGFRVGVNLFAAQFMRDDLARAVQQSLQMTGLSASSLELEITENTILRHDEIVMENLLQLRTMGVSIAFDDYGTGYASLSLLKNFPIDRLKIDQTFIKNFCNDRQDAAIVKAILLLGRSFGLKVIAEGVETEEQRRRLLSKGCEEAQGYLFGHAMAPREFASRFSLKHA